MIFHTGFGLLPVNRSEEAAANARLIAVAPEYYAAYELVAQRLADVAARGGTLQDFIDAGSMRELAIAHGKT